MHENTVLNHNVPKYCVKTFHVKVISEDWKLGLFPTVFIHNSGFSEGKKIPFEEKETPAQNAGSVNVRES